MEVKDFTLSFKHEGEKRKATVSNFRPDGARYPIYRVCVERPNSSDVYIFYKIKKEKELFWYGLPEHKNKIARSIAVALDGMVYNK